MSGKWIAFAITIILLGAMEASASQLASPGCEDQDEETGCCPIEEPVVARLFSTRDWLACFDSILDIRDAEVLA